MPSYPSQMELGSFVPTTNPQNLAQVVNLMSLALNTKDSGYYALTEFINGQVWFPDPALNSSTAQAPTLRQVFRKVINCGTLPAAPGTLTVAHGITITSGFSFTRIYGCATDPSTTFIPLPYASPVLADNIELWVDAVNVNIKVGKNQSGFTTTYVVVEFIKQ